MAGAKSFTAAARRRSTTLVSTTAGSKPALASELNIKPLAPNMAVRAARHTAYRTSFLNVWHTCSSSHTCCGSNCTPSGRCCMARLMAEAPVQIQKMCSRSCSACVSLDEAAACCQPHGQVVPPFMGRGPRALLPPHHAAWSRRHQTSFQLFSHNESFQTWRTRAGSARAVGRGFSCGWVRAARVTADPVNVARLPS